MRKFTNCHFTTHICEDDLVIYIWMTKAPSKWYFENTTGRDVGGSKLSKLVQSVQTAFIYVLKHASHAAGMNLEQ